MSLPDELQDYAAYLRARRGVMLFDDFKLKALITPDTFVRPTAVAIALGLLLQLTDSIELFARYSNWYWTACAVWFLGGIALLKYGDRIRREAYDLYLWRFDEALLRELQDDAKAWIGPDLDTWGKRESHELLRQHLRSRNEKLSTMPAGPL